MLITLLKHKKGCHGRGFAVAILVLSMMGLFFTSTRAEEKCATDFFSQKTCASFDALDQNVEKNFDVRESVAGTDLWNDYSGLSGSQIWYRNPLDGNWMSITPLGREALGNRAIHGFRCLTDLFGDVVCNRNQLTPKVPQDRKLPERR